MRIYISEAEARVLASNTVPPNVALKCAAKLKPAAPLAGQLDIIAELEAESGRTAQEPEAH